MDGETAKFADGNFQFSTGLQASNKQCYAKYNSVSTCQSHKSTRKVEVDLSFRISQHQLQ